MVMFELNRGQVPDRGVKPVGVVPVHPAGDLPFDVATVGPGWSGEVDRIGLNSPIVDSQSALSSASPTVPIEPATPAASSSAVKATETYCDPASE